MHFNFDRSEYHRGPLLKAIQIFLLILIVIGIGLIGTQKYWVPKVVEYILQGEEVDVIEALNTETGKVSGAGYKDATYRIEGTEVTLQNGLNETEVAPGSASKQITRFFGNELWKDLNNDGVPDVTFLLTQESGGSGTFFYVVAALKTHDGFTGSEAVLLGDRIAPQTTESGPGASVIVNYADRAPGESFAVLPSVGKSLRLLLDPVTMQFGEVQKNFEGEADPKIMTLEMKKWGWVNTEYQHTDMCTCPTGYVQEGNACTPRCYYSEPRCLAPSILCESTNGSGEVTPKDPKQFSLTFEKGGRMSATTDCNNVGGTYSVSGNLLTFGQMNSTLMYCEDSQEAEFVNELMHVESYHFTNKGDLVLTLKDGKGVINLK